MGGEPSTVELKAAAGGLPKSTSETISAFANAQGGTILLGLDDLAQPVDIDADGLRDALAGMAADKMQPPVRAEVEIDVVDGDRRVVRMDVSEARMEDKPVHVVARGQYGGPFVRGGDGDRRLTGYEVNRLVENRTRPTHDRSIVPEATAEDLDPDLIGPYLERLRLTNPRTFSALEDDQALRSTGVLREHEGTLVPTLAGLLTFGRHPQQFLPQLFISVVVHPGNEVGELGPRGERFLDNRQIDGPVPIMAAEATSTITRHMARASLMRDGQRTERFEYPLEVVRELIANALMHRDYSPESVGTQVQVELFPDRLVVRSPGGVYGPVDPQEFGAPDVSSSRNALLAKMLSETRLPASQFMVAENRGSGIPTIMRALNAAGMAPPTFAVNLRKVEVTVPHHALLNHEVLEWIRSLGHEGLTDAQVQALALLHEGTPVRNQTLQGWGLHPADATRELTDLVSRGVAEKIGDRRHATYRLAGTEQRPPQPTLNLTFDDAPWTGGQVDSRKPAGDARQQEILSLLAQNGEMSAKQLTDSVNVGYRTTLNAINELIRVGKVEGTAPPRSRNRAYRLTTAQDPGTSKKT